LIGCRMAPRERPDRIRLIVGTGIGADRSFDS
jgi:hypothetical protein